MRICLPRVIDSAGAPVTLDCGGAKSENQQPVGAKDDLCGVALYPDRLLD